MNDRFATFATNFSPRFHPDPTPIQSATATEGISSIAKAKFSNDGDIDTNLNPFERKIEGQPTAFLVNSGATMCIMHKKYMPDDSCPSKETEVCCDHGDCKSYPVKDIHIQHFGKKMPNIRAIVNTRKKNYSPEEFKQDESVTWMINPPLMPSIPDSPLPKDGGRGRAFTSTPGFLRKFSGTPGRTRIGKHQISTGESRPLRQRPYRIPQSCHVTIEQEVNPMLNLGVIKSSSSPQSPLVMVEKSDRSLCFWLDSHGLNNISRFDAYLLPHIDKLLETVGSKKILSVLDLFREYRQIELKKHSREKTAFQTSSRLYHFPIMPFGLHCAPTAFQHLTDKVLEPSKALARAYWDDIFIFGDS
ncbi:hypothetical protein QYM36_003146 [Artemia franciscana]|uniref:Reverse transcriptase domain-containing protein n=1 Tax=Artemia franciscana TaxID=6661 RepID=A0AA88LDW7_ARTSF|nr:hypothetical protein QYM36_003146 [Artemia franciscana]